MKIILAVLLFMFVSSARAKVTEKKEVIDFKRPIDIEGQTYKIKSSCLPPLESSKKLFNDFLSLQKKAMDGFIRYEKESQEVNDLRNILSGLSKKVTGWEEQLNFMIIKKNILGDVGNQFFKKFNFSDETIQNLNLVMTQKNHLNDLYNKSVTEGNRLAMKRYKMRDQIREYDRELSEEYVVFWQNQRSLLQTQRMFFLSFRTGQMSLYSIKTLTEGTNKQLEYLEKFIKIKQKQKPLIESLIPLYKEDYHWTKKQYNLAKEYVHLLRKTFKSLFDHNPGIKERVKKSVKEAREERKKQYDLARELASKKKN